MSESNHVESLRIACQCGGSISYQDTEVNIEAAISRAINGGWRWADDASAIEFHHFSGVTMVVINAVCNGCQLVALAKERTKRNEHKH